MDQRSDFLKEMFAAHIAFRQDDEAAGIRCLRAALARLDGHDTAEVDVLPPPVAEELLARALDHGIRPGLVRRLIARYRFSTDSPFRGEGPPPVRIYTLGRFSLLVDDKPIVVKGKAKQKPLEMLKVLVALGGRDVPMARLADVLWPEVDGDTAYKNAEVTLHRLRRLTKSGAVLLRESSLSLNPDLCRVDVWELQRNLGYIEAALQEADSHPVEYVGLWRDMEQLYRGPFLAAAESLPWAVSLREKLRSRFCRVTMQLADALKRAGALDNAVELYRRALEVDDLAEELYRGLIRSLLEAGRYAEAANAYHRCREVLGRVLGVSPSADLEALCRRHSIRLIAVNGESMAC